MASDSPTIDQLTRALPPDLVEAAQAYADRFAHELLAEAWDYNRAMAEALGDEDSDIEIGMITAFVTSCPSPGTDEYAPFPLELDPEV